MGSHTILCSVDWSVAGDDTEETEVKQHRILCSKQRVLTVAQKVQETCLIWDTIRRPSRPAGPGRPRRSEESSSTRPAVVVEPIWRLFVDSRLNIAVLIRIGVVLLRIRE